MTGIDPSGIINESFQQGIEFLKINPDVTLAFSVAGDEMAFPPQVRPLDEQTYRLQKAILGNFGHSGGTYYSTLAAVLGHATGDLGYTQTKEEAKPDPDGVQAMRLIYTPRGM